MEPRQNDRDATGIARVSVIVPFLNGGRFLREAIERVFAQTYENWELLLVDDGSTDDSTAIALRYATDHPAKVSYLEHANHENQGACASRNRGIRESRGKYIALLDADDVWFERKLEQQVAILEAHAGVGMVYGTPLYWHGWTGDPEDAGRDHLPGAGLPLDRVYEAPSLLTLS